MFSIDASATLRALKTIERRILDVPRVALQQVVRVAHQVAKETTLFKERTGKLRASIAIIDRGAFTKRLIARAPHARFINEGTKPHVILPKNGPFLVFRIGNRIIRARKVNHPGTAKRPFMDNAAAAGGQAMRVLSDEGVTKAINNP